MLRDRNSIFFTGFILGAIFSYSGMLGFFGGCVTGAIVIKNFGKHIDKSKQETQVDTQTDSQADSDWIDYEANTNKTSSEQIKDKDVKYDSLWNFVKPWQQVFR
jgi:hypothetical protein